jgi:hypothetical protein
MVSHCYQYGARPAYKSMLQIDLRLSITLVTKFLHFYIKIPLNLNGTVPNSKQGKSIIENVAGQGPNASNLVKS